MKKMIFSAAVFAAVLLSCDMAEVDKVNVDDKETACLEVRMAPGETKVSGEGGDEEKTVSSYQVLIFDRTDMMLEAYAQGVGTTWVMHFDPAVVREEFALPEKQIPVAILVMGYPADDVQASPMHSQNKAMDEIVKYL